MTVPDTLQSRPALPNHHNSTLERDFSEEAASTHGSGVHRSCGVQEPVGSLTPAHSASDINIHSEPYGKVR